MASRAGWIEQRRKSDMPSTSSHASLQCRLHGSGPATPKDLAALETMNKKRRQNHRTPTPRRGARRPFCRTANFASPPSTAAGAALSCLQRTAAHQTESESRLSVDGRGRAGRVPQTQRSTASVGSQPMLPLVSQRLARGWGNTTTAAQDTRTAKERRPQSLVSGAGCRRRDVCGCRTRRMPLRDCHVATRSVSAPTSGRSAYQHASHRYAEQVEWA